MAKITISYYKMPGDCNGVQHFQNDLKSLQVIFLHHNEINETSKSKLDNMNVFNCKANVFSGANVRVCNCHMLRDIIHIFNHISLWFAQISCSGKAPTSFMVLPFLVICHNINRR